ncbi:lipopolysaccharide biosynthesis protein [Methylophaga lonarensis MPL]|uniref:Lipopolysaccharide biosynthesis protein n=1 Tax=Methylophaga lonarensis MPL TaxID=1286106 RepID=M7P4C3_9GAMM|nr:LPS biosynthesis protein [Methylophaga lonarensis]EMR14346.1 lipopolysaccharide biosynthesis protein [Methylophaga lonarensis MPL]
MEEEVKGLRDYWDILWRRKYWILIPGLILSAIAASVAYSLPATYKSEGLILIETQDIPADLVRTTVTSYADQRIEIIRQRLLTTANIMAIIERHNLYAEQRQAMTSNTAIVNSFRSNVSVQMVQANVTDPATGRARRASIAFRVSFMDQSPQVAQRVANDLVTEFLDENVRTRVDMAADTVTFLRDEGDRFQRQVRDIESRIAQFKNQHSDSLPELLQFNLTTIDGFQRELAANERQIAVNQDQILTLGMQLSAVDQYLPAGTSAAQGRTQPSSSQQRLDQLRLELNALKSRYAATHPDVLRVERQIETLQQELGVDGPTERTRVEAELESVRLDLQSARERYAESHPDIIALQGRVSSLETRLAELPVTAATTDVANVTNNSERPLNPLYIQITAQINAMERELGRLRTRQAELRALIEEYQARVQRTHLVQQEYTDLSRDHENTLAKYRELRAKQLAAELSQTLEAESKGESFTLIEPPVVPNTAEKPDRRKLTMMGVVASFGATGGLAFLYEMLFGGVRGYNAMTHALGRAPLVVIPIIPTERDRRRKRLKWTLLFIILIAAGIAAVAVFHFYVMHLEVFWFKLMNKLSLL